MGVRFAIVVKGEKDFWVGFVLRIAGSLGDIGFQKLGSELVVELKPKWTSLADSGNQGLDAALALS